MIDVDVLLISEVLKVPVSQLYMLSNDRNSREKRKKKAYSNYHTVIIHCGKGHKNRTLTVPNEFLKMVQRRILERCLYKLTVSEYSTAYLKGRSLLDNAIPHIGSECILKLDISDFYDHIDDYMVYMVMRQFKLSKRATSLLTNLCIHNGRLPQGAPTSPYIANLVMKYFDIKLGAWCMKRNIAYTRYCDDMTFSGSKESVRNSLIIKKVSRMLWNMGFLLNQKKTLFVSASQQQRVTGIIVNVKPDIPRDLRKAIRQEVYYCKKYGVKDHLEHKKIALNENSYLNSLLGRISYALQINSDNSEMRQYFSDVKNLIRSDLSDISDE